jgi:glycerol kinase
LLCDLHKREFSDDLCELFGVPPAVLPQVRPSSGRIGVTRGVPGLPDGIPITGVAGDQQAALFGQDCTEPGDAKCTYGTGAFLLMNLGPEPRLSTRGLLTTVAWTLDAPTASETAPGSAYAFEGSAFIAGALVQWLRDGLGLISAASEIEALARRRAVSSPESPAVRPGRTSPVPRWRRSPCRTSISCRPCKRTPVSPSPGCASTAGRPPTTC